MALLAGLQMSSSILFALLSLRIFANDIPDPLSSGAIAGVEQAATALVGQSGPVGQRSGGPPCADFHKPIKGHDIYFQLCRPWKLDANRAVQVTVHGITYDHTYFNLNFTDARVRDYSYTNYANSQGAIVLNYDRLGTGRSAQPRNTSETNSQLQIEISRDIVEQVRQGKLFSTSSSSSRNRTPRVVQIGHSYGSMVTNGVMTQFPDLLDASVLTGYSRNITAQQVTNERLGLAPAREVDPARFGDLPKEYLTSGTIQQRTGTFYETSISNVELARKTYNFDLAHKDENTKLTVTEDELATFGAGLTTADRFKRPLLVVIGNEDSAFCDSNCGTGPESIPAQQKRYFPSSQFEYATIANTGHCINQHYSAPDSYKVIDTFLRKHHL